MGAAGADDVVAVVPSAVATGESGVDVSGCVVTSTPGEVVTAPEVLGSVASSDPHAELKSTSMTPTTIHLMLVNPTPRVDDRRPVRPVRRLLILLLSE